MYAGKAQIPEAFVPKNISGIFEELIIFIGLVPKTGPLPQNRKFWTRPTASM